MRKTPLSSSAAGHRSALDTWIDIEDLAAVEITSEDPAHPFENALRGQVAEGWRAAQPGPQTIRIRFDHARPVRRIRLAFRESRGERSQEFSLAAISSSGERLEIVRQQWNFSPTGSNIEVEDYTVQLPDVVTLELQIDPGRHDRRAIATLQSLAVA